MWFSLTITNQSFSLFVYTDLTFFSNLSSDCRWVWFFLLPFSNWQLLPMKHPQFPNVSTAPRALAAPHIPQPDMDGQRCFQGCSGIPALLPVLWLLLVSGLTLTSSGVRNSGILPPNSRLFPPMGRNPYYCYQTLASKVGRFFLSHSFYSFPPTHLHPNTNAWLPLLYRCGRSGFKSKYLCWHGHGIPGALCCHSELQNDD